MMNEKWFSLDISEIEKKLKTNAASGLSRKAARYRGNRGAGHLFYVPYKSPWKLFFELLSDIALIILFIGATASLFFDTEEYLRGITVLLIIFCNLLFCSVMYFRSQRTMESLTSLFYPMARVIRGGKLFHVDFRNVVVGDVILLEAGDIICCDARIVSSDSLKVKMRVDNDNYIDLDKSSKASVDTREKYAKNMSNMIHAGSVIEKGNARAIVTAIGKYTYLGAMTGGIPLPISDESPKLLKKMRKQFFTINIVMLIAVLPFTVISLLLGNMIAERESFLSVAFLTALSIAATTMPQLICSMFKLFYTSKIRKLLLSKNASAVRSVASIDKLAEADYIFMLDGCAVTDGILHFQSAVCAEGEIKNYKSLNKTATIFAEYAYMYYAAATQTLTTGVVRTEEFFCGIRAFIEKTGIDTGALKYRCSLISYTSGNMKNISERMHFTDQGVHCFMKVFCSPDAIKSCKTALIGGIKQPLSAEGIRTLESQMRKYEALGQTPIIFTVSSGTEYLDECFIGMIILKEGIDDKYFEIISLLNRYGCKVISFIRSDNAPKLPDALFKRGCAAKSDFERNKLPLTYNFGSISSYSGFTDKDIEGLITQAHLENKKVAVLGFSERASKIALNADSFVTCSSVIPQVSGYLDEEINVSEISGQIGSSACVQKVKEKADCIINRPQKGQGGLTSLVYLFGSIRSVYNNISDYLRYLISSNIICCIMVALPMLLGNATLLDARHVMICSFVFNMFTFFAFMLRSRSIPSKKNYCSVNRIREYFIGDKAMVIPSVASALYAIFCPYILDLVIDGYEYKIEVLFTSMSLLHLTAFVMLFYGNNFKELKYFYKNSLLLIESSVMIIILALGFIFGGFGALIGFEGFMGLPYFIISLTPVAVYVLVFIGMNIKKQKRNF